MSTRPCELETGFAFERCCVRFRAWAPWLEVCGHVNIKPALILSDAVCDLGFGRFESGFQAMRT